MVVVGFHGNWAILNVWVLLLDANTKGIADLRLSFGYPIVVGLRL